MLQLWLQLISLLCCSEGERVSMCVWERGRGRRREGGTERQHVHQRATYRTLGSHRSPPFLLPSFLSPFSLLCFFLFCPFFFYLFIFCFTTLLVADSFLLAFSYFLLSSFPLQFSRLLFLRCTLKMTPLILRSRSRQPPGQPQQPSEELCQWASGARICPF